MQRAGAAAEGMYPSGGFAGALCALLFLAIARCPAPLMQSSGMMLM
jgi:hypothetical protein